MEPLISATSLRYSHAPWELKQLPTTQSSTPVPPTNTIEVPLPVAALPSQTAALHTVDMDHCPRCHHILNYAEETNRYFCPVDGWSYFTHRPPATCDEYDNRMQFNYQVSTQPTATEKASHTALTQYTIAHDMPVLTMKQYLLQYTLDAANQTCLQEKYIPLLRKEVELWLQTDLKTAEETTIPAPTLSLIQWEMLLQERRWCHLLPFSHVLYALLFSGATWDTLPHIDKPEDYEQLSEAWHRPSDVIPAGYNQSSHVPYVPLYKRKIVLLRRFLQQSAFTDIVLGDMSTLKTLLQQTKEPVTGLKLARKVHQNDNETS